MEQTCRTALNIQEKKIKFLSISYFFVHVVVVTFNGYGLFTIHYEFVRIKHGQKRTERVLKCQKEGRVNFVAVERFVRRLSKKMHLI